MKWLLVLIPILTAYVGYLVGSHHKVPQSNLCQSIELMAPDHQRGSSVVRSLECTEDPNNLDVRIREQVWVR